MNQIAVIIVLYYPTAEDIDHLTLLGTTHYGAIIDNSPERTFNIDKVGKMFYHHNGENIGIAAAQNKGVSLCLENNPATSYLVFLDQDTRVDITYPELIAAELQSANESIGKTGVIGPNVINSDTNKAYSSKISKDKAIAPTLKEKLFVISSGCCISSDTWSKVGGFDEAMFIDFVDSEWCWRAKAKGYNCVCTTKLTISHKVGQRIFKMGPYQDIISKPFRYYYQYRNYLWLCKRGYVPMKWKIKTGIKYLLRFAYVPFATTDGKGVLRIMANGIKDGLKNGK